MHIRFDYYPIRNFIQINLLVQHRHQFAHVSDEPSLICFRQVKSEPDQYPKATKFSVDEKTRASQKTRISNHFRAYLVTLYFDKENEKKFIKQLIHTFTRTI